MTWSKRTNHIVHEAEPYNAEAEPRALGRHRLTDPGTFYVRSHGPVPDGASASWRLRINGLVRCCATLTLEDLQTQFEQVTVAATLQCAGNQRAGLERVAEIPGEAPWGAGATSTAEWTGVRLRDVLLHLGLNDSARHVLFDAPDVSEIPTPPQNFGGSISLEKALQPEVILAWEMNGLPLPPAHGAPLRAVVPGFIGARSVKWLNRIRVASEPSENYFQASAYRLLPPDFDPAEDDPGKGLPLSSVALNSAFFLPESAQVPAGGLRLSGYAFAGDDRRAARVDVSIDGGRTWEAADLEPAPSRWTWQFWHCDVDLSVGDHVLVVRAWDSTGALQPESAESVWNPKGYINNSWQRINVTAAEAITTEK